MPRHSSFLFTKGYAINSNWRKSRGIKIILINDSYDQHLTNKSLSYTSLTLVNYKERGEN